ncbi:NAD(P)/FAD-dependent oxidoreductase [Caldithrix abyssi]
MSKVVIIGAGFAGHTAALYLGSTLGKNHEITVINKQDYFLFIPSLVWVGVGHMKPEKTYFKLAPVYRKVHVNFVHGSATEVHPDEQFVVAQRAGDGAKVKLDYDYLIIATGPKLNFEGTKNLGPHHGFTHSICTLDHAVQTRDKYLELLERMKKGEKFKIVIGTGHPAATCQGAAFEYLSNIHKDLVKKGLRDKAELVWFSNEPKLGDFGVKGIEIKKNGRLLTSEDWLRDIFSQYDIKWEIQKGAYAVDEKTIYWEDLQGNRGETSYDFAMLIPQFLGSPMKYLDRDGNDISSKVVNKAGLVLVDAIYGLDYEQLEQNPDAWPAVYQNPTYKNIFAAGIAFAPPGPISRPSVNPNGLSITPAPPRTGMVSGIIGRIVAKNVIDLIKRGRMTHAERMSEMFAACIASMGDSLWDGEAGIMIIYPVVPDMRKYPNEMGRDNFVTHMELGLAGAWMKRMIHTTFMWKFQARPGWSIIPE